MTTTLLRELLRVSDEERGFDRGKGLQSVLRDQLEQSRTAPPLS